MPDTYAPALLTTREYCGVTATCPVHGTVATVIQFNQDPERSYCGVCLEERLLGTRSSVEIVTPDA